MRVTVKVIARARHNKIQKEPDGSLKIWTTAVPEDNKANKAVIKAVSDFTKTPKSEIKITHGKTSSRKILEIAG